MGSDSDEETTSIHSNSNNSDLEEEEDQQQDDYSVQSDGNFSDVGDGVGVPSAKGGYEDLFAVDLECPKLGEVSQDDLADLSGSPLFFTNTFETPLHHRNKKGALSSRANLAKEEQRKKKAGKVSTSSKKKRTKTKAPEKDDLRPKSEKDLFSPLQKAKEKQRKAAQLRLSQQDGMPTKITQPMTKSKVVLVPESEWDDDTPLAAKRAWVASQKKAKDEEKKKGKLDKTSTSSRARKQKPDQQQVVPTSISEDSSSPTSDSGAIGRKMPDSAQKSVDSNDSSKTDYAQMTNEEVDTLCLAQHRKDQKTKTADRLGIIDKLRRKQLELRIACAKDVQGYKNDWDKLKTQYTQLKDALKSSIVQVATLRAENESLIAAADVRMSRAKAQVLKMCNDTKDKAFETAKFVLFHRVKFLNCKDDLYDATESVHDILQMRKKNAKPPTEDEKHSWVETYAPVVKKGINTQRNYFTSELKKAAFALMEKNEALPPPELLLACAARNISGTNEQKFKWYWEKVLPKVVGSKEWGPSVCYYTTISEARMSTNPDKALVTISDEAMIALVWENNFEKWQTQYAFERNPENVGKKQPALPGKFTQSDKGQCEWGGWSEAGLKKFNTNKKTIRGFRKDKEDQVLAFERKILAELRAENAIEADDHEQQQKMNRSKRRKIAANKPVVQVVVRKRVRTTDSDDEM